MVIQKRLPVAIIISLTLISLFGSCQKDEIVHENLIIENNTPPPNDGISTLELQNYINNLYIDLFGRAPTEGEMEERSTALREADFSAEGRAAIIEDMMASYEYYKNINVLTTQELLVDADSLSIVYQIDLYEYFIELNNLSGDTISNYYLEYEIDKMEKLLSAPGDFYSGTIGLNEYYKRFIHNYFYDEVNMGSLNFVVACFENLFNRLPTVEETADGIAMVDGVSSQLFLIDGSSKIDFIQIVTNHLEFYQGLVADIYSTFLAREPNSWEMSTYALQLQEENHFNAVKSIILQSEEYAGF
jgi:hypothetical protein